MPNILHGEYNWLDKTFSEAEEIMTEMSTKIKENKEYDYGILNSNSKYDADLASTLLDFQNKFEKKLTMIPNQSQSYISSDRNNEESFSENEIDIFNNNSHRKFRKYKSNSIIADICQKEIRNNLYPQAADISNMVENIMRIQKITNSKSEEKKIRSLIREWFRKRREYLAGKVYRSCEILLPLNPDEGESITDLVNRCLSNDSIIKKVILNSKLPIDNEHVKRQFVNQKVTDFYFKYPSRKIK
jgi:hypothetical protein